MGFGEGQDYAYNNKETNDYSDTTGSLNEFRSEITEQQAKTLKQRSIENVGEEEVNLFIKIFNSIPNSTSRIYSSSDLIEQVKRIQYESFAEEIKQTGIIDEETLKAIYINFSQYNRQFVDDSTSSLIRERTDNYLKGEVQEKTPLKQDPRSWENQESSQEPAKVEATDDFNKFLKQRESEIRGQMTGEFNSNSLLVRNYFASSKRFNNDPIGSENSKFISKGIDRKLFSNDDPYKNNNNGNSIFISKLGGKVILRFYISGELYLSTIVSPGEEFRPTDQNFYSSIHTTGIYHKSNLYPTLEENQEKGINKAGGAIMPYAVYLADGIWIHGSADKIDGNYHSHGCIRTPTYYAKEIFDRVNEIQNSGKTVTIDTRGIY